MKTQQQAVESILDSWTRNTQALIRIPSVLSTPKEGAPFGCEINLALEETLNIAKNLGFKTYKDPEGYYGYADIGTGTPMIGILGHIDVVPAGDAATWTKPAFEPYVKDGKLYGRGSQDDKGPLLASMYALKLLNDQVSGLRKTFRIIIGTDEETLWRGIAKYTERETMPDFGFSPDSKFPLIYAEKGLLQFNLTAPVQSDLKLTCGDAYNAVPSQAIYQNEELAGLKKVLNEHAYTFDEKEDALIIKGKAAHAANTELGINAITRLAIALKDNNKKDDSIHWLANYIGEDPYATKLFGKIEDEASGKLKCNVGKWSIDDTVQHIGVDVRIPISATKETIVEAIKASLKDTSLTYEEHDYLRSIYVPKESYVVKTLMEAYQSVTGDTTSVPQSSGGATYARAMDQCVAFGAVLPNTPKTEHQPNEYITLDDVKIAIQVYMEACRLFNETEAV